MIGCSHYCILFIIFLTFFYNFFGLFYLYPWELFVFEIFLRFFIFFHTFSRFLKQVYRFYSKFLVFHFFHLFSAFLFYATAFLLNFIDCFPENVISDFKWIAAYIFWRLLKTFFRSLFRNYFRHWGGCLLSIYLYVIYYFAYIVSVLWHKSIDIFAIC